MTYRVLLLFISLAFLGCQTAAGPSSPSPAPQSPSPVAAEPSQWTVSLQSWETGALPEEVSVRGSTVELLSGTSYKTADNDWSAPSLDGWSTEKPQQGQYLAFSGEDSKEHYLPADQNQELADQLEALKPKAFAFGPDYAWVSGRLDYADLEGGTWTLVYAEEPGEDPHGGKVVLQGEIPEGIEAGDTVVVFGSIAEAQMGINMAGTYYEVREISKTEN